MSEGRRRPIPRRLLVALLAVGAFTTALNVTQLSPLLTRIAVDFGVTNAAAGQLATLTAVCAATTALLTAPWLDRYGRGAWLRFESVLLGAGTLISVLAPSVAWLVVGRALAGVGGAIIFGVCLATVGDLFPEPTKRNRAVGVVGTAATLGAVAGLPIVTQIADLGGWRWALGAILPLVVVLFAGSFLFSDAVAPKEGSLWRGWATGYRVVLASGETLSLLGVMVAVSMAWFGWLIYFGAYTETVFGVGAAMLGLLFMVGGGAEVVANNVTPLLLERRSPRTVVLWATLVMSATLLSVGIADTRSWVLFPFIAVASFSSVVIFSSTCILLLDSLPAARGAAMALQSAGFEAGGALGAAVAGAGLAVLGDYELVYRLLGLLLLPLLLVPLALGTRRAAPSAFTAAPADVGG